MKQEEKRKIHLQKLLKKYEGYERNQNGLTILGGEYNKNNVLLDFDLLEFRKDGKILNYIFLNKKQKKAFRSFQDDKDKAEEILYGGGAGGGKSFILNLIIFLNAILLPGSGWFVGRRVLKDVRTSTISDLINLMNSCGFDQYQHNQQDSMIKFSNGSFIRYGELENLPSDPTFKRLGSYQYTGIFIDEAQETVLGAKSALRFRLRLNKKVEVKEDGIEKIIWRKKGKMYFSCNPGKNWLFTDFYLPYEKKNLPLSKKFIQALPEDNEFLDDEVIDLYRNTDDKVMREIYYNGNWHYDDDPSVLFDYDDLNQIFERNIIKNKDDEYYMSVDIAGKGKDKTIIVIWRGNVGVYIYKEDVTDQAELIKTINKFEEQYKIKRKHIVVDTTGIGVGIADNLKGCVRFLGGSKSIEKKIEEERKNYKEEKEYTKILYNNDRSACFFKLSEEIKKGNIFFEYGVYKEEIINELSFIKEEISISDTNVKKVISKEKIKKMLGNSPDFADAISMKMIFNILGNNYKELKYEEIGELFF